jgi:hypothetical protein
LPDPADTVVAGLDGGEYEAGFSRQLDALEL